jgi:CubicO group peptidase (beta-lactamase class C family)
MNAIKKLRTALIVASVSASLAAADSTGSRQSSSAQSDLAARISRIENGLLPAVVIKGIAPKRMRLRDRMEHYKVPGVSVAFLEAGQIAWTRAYGFADVAHKRPVTVGTLFQAASISKPVSALAALRLVQDGRISLDQDVNLKLRTWKVPENEFTKVQKVTLRRILSHTAGLTVHGFPGYGVGHTLPTIAEILDGVKPANTPPIRVDVVPGAGWRYSGGGYVVMQLLLTDVTGISYPQIVSDLVLKPARMTRSTYEQPLPKDLWPSAAVGYQEDGSPVKGGWHSYPEMAPAGLWTTPSDLAFLAIEVQKEYAGKSDGILLPEMARQALAIQSDGSGLGFAVEKHGNELRFGHGGSNEGFECDFQAYTDSGQGIVIMTNGQQGLSLISEIRRAVSKEYNWPDFQPKEHTLASVSASVLSSYVGLYEVPNEGQFTIRLKHDELYLQADPMIHDEKLLAESDRHFFIMSEPLEFIFNKDEKGAVTSLTVHGESREFVAKKTQ